MAHAAPGCLPRAVHRARTESHSSRKTATIMQKTAIYSRDPYGDNPHPRPDRIPSNPILPGSGPPRKKTARSGTSGAFPWARTWFQVCREGRKRSEAKRSPSGTPGATGGPVTVAQTGDRHAGHVVAKTKSPQCMPWEVTDFTPSSGIWARTTAGCWSAAL